MLASCQFGFRPKLSKENTMHHMCEEIYGAHSQREYAVSVFMDLTKAFDTISHSILLRKHQYYGINGSAQDCFKSYLSIRQQYVVADKEKSETLNITTGVVQGSILGPNYSY